VSSAAASKRAYGSGSIVREGGSWYGKWRVGQRQVKRRLGPVRPVGSSEGLTRKQAEAALRRVMDEVKVLAPEQRITFAQAAERYVQHVEHVLRRKPSTVQDYRIIVRRHLAPHFEGRTIEGIEPAHVEFYIAAKLDAGLAVKTITNHLNFAHGAFQFALRRGWVTSNPVALTERPRAAPADPDIRFLSSAELEALLRSVALEHTLGPTDHALYTAAAMTGLRQGELVALRWRDVDWSAGVVRVRRTFSRQAWGKPKSRRSSRAVPIADRVAAELERHFQRSAYKADDDLVFCHPHTGNPYDASKLRERFYAAMTAAGMGHRCGRKGASPSTRCATPSARAWRPWACRCARCRSGWATATSRPRSSTRTSLPIRPAARHSSLGRSAPARRRLRVRPRGLAMTFVAALRQRQDRPVFGLPGESEKLAERRGDRWRGLRAMPRPISLGRCDSPSEDAG
jgi:integrase